MHKNHYAEFYRKYSFEYISDKKDSYRKIFTDFCHTSHSALLIRSNWFIVKVWSKKDQTRNPFPRIRLFQAVSPFPGRDRNGFFSCDQFVISTNFYVFYTRKRSMASSNKISHGIWEYLKYQRNISVVGVEMSFQKFE